MAYDEQLANRVRQAFGARDGIAERKMFGGFAFLCLGRMCCGIVGSDLMVRIPDIREEDVDAASAFAASKDMRITHVIDTHVHADHHGPRGVCRCRKLRDCATKCSGRAVAALGV